MNCKYCSGPSQNLMCISFHYSIHSYDCHSDQLSDVSLVLWKIGNQTSLYNQISFDKGHLLSIGLQGQLTIFWWKCNLWKTAASYNRYNRIWPARMEGEEVGSIKYPLLSKLARVSIHFVLKVHVIWNKWALVNPIDEDTSFATQTLPLVLWSSFTMGKAYIPYLSIFSQYLPSIAAN